MEKRTSITDSMSILDRLACLVTASALFVVGSVFMVLGVTFLPVVGIFASIPVLGLAYGFLARKGISNERIAGFLVPNSVMP
jgi:CHASE2 domain-containing sensor protein